MTAQFNRSLALVLRMLGDTLGNTYTPQVWKHHETGSVSVTLPGESDRWLSVSEVDGMVTAMPFGISSVVSTLTDNGVDVDVTGHTITFNGVEFDWNTSSHGEGLVVEKSPRDFLA